MARHRRNIKKYLWKQDDRWQFLAGNIIPQLPHSAINYSYFLIKLHFNKNKNKITNTVVCIYVKYCTIHSQHKFLLDYQGDMQVLRPTAESVAKAKKFKNW